MTTPLQLTMGIDAPHRNQYLFSDHYLDSLLPADPRWDEALAETEAFLVWLQDLYSREQNQLANYNEAQLEDHWFKPILKQLGHTFEPQATVPGLEKAIKKPDYVFFPTEASRQAAVSAQRTNDYVAEALAVGEVKQWDIPLGKKQKGGGASFDAHNPSYQIDYYVRTTGLQWGMLSNGRLWRLVHTDSSQRLSVYYEVDLVDLLSRAEARAMRYFTLFFRQAAFRPDAQGRHFLTDALTASRAYAVALEEDLKQNVYQALEKLMQGFLELPRNNLTETHLREIYENSLYLLYRLLFILYGESRGLLPMDRPAYRDHYSLDRLKREFARLSSPPAPMTQKYWGDVAQLFQIINGDDAALNQHLGVPRYNGGLFDPALHPFLGEKAVGDRALVEAVNLLSQRQTERGMEFVDYRTLGVRQLGSVYEGLLEYQPRYASEPMVAIRQSKSKGEQWVTVTKAPQKATVIERRNPGQIYLETDRGERKATGSYYTPQYIVEYIVENTLGPLVEEARERVKARAKQAKGKEARAEAEQSLVAEILTMKVLDPAMGSGHFLVEATDFLALSLATDPYVETETLTEEDLTHWKRRVVERCIYGVDKNPLAVELAKLSLWLDTVAADKPLSFIDHHLKCGDALVGARVADLGWAPPPILSKKAQKQVEQQKAGQMNIFGYFLSQQLPVVMGKILEITGVESDSYDTVQAKEAADRAVQELKTPFEAVANLWTSAYFDHKFKQGDYDAALNKLSQPADLLALPAVSGAQSLAGERRFFHWELAFPEVFYDDQGQPLGEKAGFDAVVGNPPYGMLQPHNTPMILLEYLRTSFKTSSFKVDMFTLFIEAGVTLATQSGQIGMIVPNTFILNIFAQDIRQLLLEQTKIQQLLVSQDRLFPEADVHNGIFVVRKEDSDLKDVSHLKIIRNVDAAFLQRNLESSTAIVNELQQNHLDFSGDGTWHIKLSDRTVSILKRIEGLSERLDNIAFINRGLITGDRNTFFSDHKVDDRWYPILVGGDVYRYFVQKPKEFVLFERPDTAGGSWDKEVHFHPRKLVMRQIGSYPQVGIDYNRFCVTGNIFVIRIRENVEPLYVLSILNSFLIQSIWILLFQDFKVSFTELKGAHINQIPIRRIEFTTPTEERQQLVAQAISLYDQGDVEALLAFTQARLEDLTGFANLSGLEPSGLEEADVIHDLLAHLAEQMIEMNKAKQGITEDFWLDLEGVTDEDTFPKLQKGKRESTLAKQTACQPFTNPDSHSTRRLEESLAWNEAAFKAFVRALAGSVPGLSAVVNVFRQHSPAYSQLVDKIATTDRLIDRIVYQLYGLTEEEIKIVEGA